MSERDPIEEFLAGRPTGDPELERVAAALHRGENPEPSEALLRATRARVRASLAAEATPGKQRSRRPWRLALATAFPAALCLALQAWLLSVAAPWLATLLPGPLAWLLVGGYVATSAVWLALFWLALPPLAHAHNRLSTTSSSVTGSAAGTTAGS